MKNFFKITLLLVIYGINLNITTAQGLTKKYQKDAIETLSNLMNDYYVFPEVAQQTADYLKKQLKQGYFKDFQDNKTFAAALTESVQSINHDKHMRIRANPPYVAPVNTPERIIEEHLEQIEWNRFYNSGFKTVKVLEGNVGYIDLRGFARIESGKDMADAYMKLIANCDAVIINLSKNGGGSPDMVQYLCSYFFDAPVHLNSLYYRDGDQTIDFWSLENVGGKKMVNVPLFVITSNRTFSGAEEFSYNMQTQKRATLVGQTSGGGANPGGTIPINDKLSVFIPTGKAINPITKTNWEGVGVIPEIKTTTEETLDKTHALAKAAAEEYRTINKEKHNQQLLDLSQALNNTKVDDKQVLEKITASRDAELLNENSINMLGYNYLIDQKKPESAIAIFKANVALYPNSPNVYDSYAEALMTLGDLENSHKNYKKAVEIATQNNDLQIEFYQENLKTLEAKMKGK